MGAGSVWSLIARKHYKMPWKDKAYKAAYWRSYRKANPDKVRSDEMRRRRGITLEQYNVRLAAQNGKCAICGNVETALDPKSGRVRRLAIDHSHATGKIRGLLCSWCNHGLGKFRDNRSFLAKAIAYLADSELGDG